MRPHSNTTCLRHSSLTGVDGQGLLNAIEHFIKAFDQSDLFEQFLYKTFEDLTYLTCVSSSLEHNLCLIEHGIAAVWLMGFPDQRLP